MIKVKTLINLLKKNDISYFTGVPDSVLKELSKIIQNNTKLNHTIAANEGSAVSIGIGYYLATKKLPVVYLQNSGLSNALNPLVSIAHKRVYSIPMVLIIGWRGSPGIKDEPQHNTKGKITREILNLLNIKYTILESDTDFKKFDKQIKFAKKNKTIVACLIKNGTFEKSNVKVKNYGYKLDKERVLKTIVEKIKDKTKIICSTGYNSRELMYIRKKYNLKKGSDFYMVGGMGHTLSVALGYSMFCRQKTICIDGDGSLLMHLGSFNTAGAFANSNFKYILLNNNSHDSVGGQKTFANNINFQTLSKSFGFKKFYCIENIQSLESKIDNFLNEKKLSFLEIKVASCKIKSLPRPKNLIKIKNNFMF